MANFVTLVAVLTGVRRAEQAIALLVALLCWFDEFASHVHIPSLRSFGIIDGNLLKSKAYPRWALFLPPSWLRFLSVARRESLLSALLTCCLGSPHTVRAAAGIFSRRAEKRRVSWRGRPRRSPQPRHTTPQSAAPRRTRCD